MNFRDVVGHARQIRLLSRAVRRGSVPHALLFTGIPGSGRKTLARALAGALLCGSPDDADACNRCPSCERLQRGTHPDFHEVRAEGRFIRIDQVREIKRLLMYKPLAGDTRVLLLFDVQYLNTDAANALLKSLEEPPPGNYFVLTAADERALLSTLVSRCRRMDLAPLPAAVVADYLVRYRNVRPERAPTLAELSGGSLGRAMELAEPEEDEKTGNVLSRRAEIIRQLMRLKKNDTKEALFLAKTWSDLQDDADEWLDLLRYWLRDRWLFSSGVPLDRLVNRDVFVGLSLRPDPLSAQRFQRMIEYVEEASKVLGQNANKRLVLERLLLQIAYT